MAVKSGGGLMVKMVIMVWKRCWYDGTSWTSSSCLLVFIDNHGSCWKPWSVWVVQTVHWWSNLTAHHLPLFTCSNYFNPNKTCWCCSRCFYRSLNRIQIRSLRDSFQAACQSGLDLQHYLRPATWWLIVSLCYQRTRAWLFTGGGSGTHGY